MNYETMTLEQLIDAYKFCEELFDITTANKLNEVSMRRFNFDLFTL